jgi:hypothetical protein
VHVVEVLIEVSIQRDTGCLRADRSGERRKAGREDPVDDSHLVFPFEYECGWVCAD